MGWWIVGSFVTVLVLGYVAHKYPTLFGAAVADGATVVNDIDSKVKGAVAPKANTAPVANTVSANTSA